MDSATHFFSLQCDFGLPPLQLRFRNPLLKYIPIYHCRNRLELSQDHYRNLGYKSCASCVETYKVSNFITNVIWIQLESRGRFEHTCPYLSLGQQTLISTPYTVYQHDALYSKSFALLRNRNRNRQCAKIDNSSH